MNPKTARTKYWTRRAAVFLGLVPAALAIACGSSGLADTGSGAKPGGDQVLPTPTQPSGDVGNPPAGLPVEVRDVVLAFTSGDAAAVGAVLTLSKVPCATPQGMGAGAPPVCPAGVADGTLVDVFPFGVCEGSYLEPNNFRQVVGDRYAGSTFYAAYQRTSSGTEAWPLGTVAVVFHAPSIAAQGTADWGFTAGIKDGKVVNVTFGCGSNPAQIVEMARDRGAWVVEPAS